MFIKTKYFQGYFSINGNEKLFFYANSKKYSLFLFFGQVEQEDIRGHSITMWTRGEGQKMSVLVHAQGIKTAHARGQKWQNSVHVVFE